jgi:DNA-binding NarL/FixJ family response regulator
MSNHHSKFMASKAIVGPEPKWGTMRSRCVATSRPIGVLVADSNHMHCQLLAGALRRRAEFRVSSCALESEAMAATIAKNSIDVALLKTNDEASFLHGFHLAHPQIANILLLEELSRNPVINAFRFGARGVFELTDSSFRMLCKCIQRVHQGQIWINSEQIAYLIEAIALAPGMRVVNSKGIKLLTPREEQVVALVADGLSNRYIALELGLSEHTIKKYLFRIFDKLGVSTRVELVLYAMNHGSARPVECIPA